MGINLTCQKAENEEEILFKILNSMNLSEIETKSAYGEFLKCINKDEIYLDFFLFNNYLTKIVGDTSYKKAQTVFFENLRKLDDKKRNIKMIGCQIVYLSKGNNSQKIEQLYEHYKAYYTSFDEKTVKEFITDIIDANTDNCLTSFRENLGHEGVENMTDIWKKIRKKKLLYHIFLNYESVKMKYHRSPGKISIEKMGKTFLLEEEDITNIAVKKCGMKDDIVDAYEKYNKSQCDVLFKKNFHFDKAEKKDDNLTDDQKVIKEFIELCFSQLSGEYIRTWLNEDYVKEKSYEVNCI